MVFCNSRLCVDGREDEMCLVTCRMVAPVGQFVNNLPVFDLKCPFEALMAATVKDILLVVSTVLKF